MTTPRVVGLDPTLRRSIARASMVIGGAVALIGIDGLRLATGRGAKGAAIGGAHELLFNHMNVLGAIAFIVAGAMTFASAFPPLERLRLAAALLHLVCAVVIVATLRAGQDNPLAADGGTFVWHLGLAVGLVAIVLTVRSTER